LIESVLLIRKSNCLCHFPCCCSLWHWL